MKKIFKITFVIILVLILLIVVSPIIFKGKIRTMVLKEANKNLNARLDVGKVKLSLIRSFPDAFVELNDILITGINDFDADTLLKIKKFAVSLSVMDLIGGSPYVIKKISADKADVRLKVLNSGKANWDIVKASESEAPSETTSGQDKIRLLLKSLVIKDSRLVYDDVTFPTLVILEGMNHKLNGDLGADFTTLETQTSVTKAFVRYDGIDYLRDAVIGWQADLDADLVKYIYTFRENKLTINDFPVTFNGTVGLPNDGYDLDLTFSTPENGFKQLLSLIPAVYSQDFASVKTDGKIGFDGFVKGKYIDDQYPAFRVNLSVGDAWFQYPGLPASVNDINITARIESPGGVADNTVVDVEKLTMKLAGNPVTARLYLKNPISDPYIDTRVEADINLADVKNFYPMEKGEELNGRVAADITLKGRLSDVQNERYNAFEASGTFNSSGINYTTNYLAQKIRIEEAGLTVTPAYLDLSALKVKAGKSDFSLKGKIENYLAYYLKGDVLRGDFDMKSNRIDVNELLAFPATGEQPGITDTTGLTAFVVPAGLDLVLKVSASQVEYMNYDISNLSGLIRIKDQKLILDDVSMNGLGGRLQMNGSYSSANPLKPAVDFSLGLKDISVRETFKSFSVVKKFAPIAEKILGDFSGNLKLAGFLDKGMMPLLESLTGSGDIVTSELTVTNVNTLDQLSNSLKMEQLKELKVAGAKLMMEFMDGSMDVKPFDFKALGIDMNLGGKTSLDQKIGYVLKMKIPRSMMGGAANSAINDLVAKAGQAGADIRLGDYINVDALIDGTITDPKVHLNLAGTGKDIVESLKDQAKEQIEQKAEELEGKAKAEADKYLQDADRQAQAIMDQAKKESDEVLKAAQGLADEAKKQANANADKMVNEAKGKGQIAELAAKKSAEEVRKQGDKQAKNIMDEAAKKSAAILDKARLEADKIKAEAQKKVNQ